MDMSTAERIFGSTIDVIIIISAPFKPFEFDNGCNYYIIMVNSTAERIFGSTIDVIIIISDPFKPFEFDDGCNYYIIIVNCTCASILSFLNDILKGHGRHSDTPIAVNVS